MMQDLHLILFFMGAIFLIILLLHGLWTRRKERSAVFRNCPIKQLKQERQDQGEPRLFKRDKSVSVGKVRMTRMRYHDNLDISFGY